MEHETAGDPITGLRWTRKTTAKIAAVDSIQRWWLDDGSHRYPQATELALLADCGGANGPNNRAWNRHLPWRRKRRGLRSTRPEAADSRSFWCGLIER